MNWVDNRKNGEVPFSVVFPGQCFVYCSDLFMRLETRGVGGDPWKEVVNLTSGKVVPMNGDDLVTIVEAEVVTR